MLVESSPSALQMLPTGVDAAQLPNDSGLAGHSPAVSATRQTPPALPLVHSEQPMVVGAAQNRFWVQLQDLSPLLQNPSSVTASLSEQ